MGPHLDGAQSTRRPGTIAPVGSQSRLALAAGSLAAASPGWLTVALLTVLLAQADAAPALHAVSEVYLAGQAANILMPFRGGEVIRLGMLAAQTPINLTSATLSILTEKVLD